MIGRRVNLHRMRGFEEFDRLEEPAGGQIGLRGVAGRGDEHAEPTVRAEGTIDRLHTDAGYSALSGVAERSAIVQPFVRGLVVSPSPAFLPGGT